MDAARKYSDAELERISKRMRKEYARAARSMRTKAENLLDDHDISDGQAAYAKWLFDGAELLARDAVKADKTVMDFVRNSVADVFAESANFAIFDVERQALVNTGFHLLDRNAVLALARDNPRILPAPKINVPKDIAWNKRHIAQALQQGILQGESADKIAVRMRGIVDMDRRAAMRNARTAVNAAENIGKMHSYEKAAKMGIGLRKEWVATLDGRTRDSHRILDGEKVPLDEPFSNGLMAPSDPDGIPAEVYNCRCRMITSVDGHDTSGADRNSNLGVMDYEQWKEGARL